jgi:hypothetical protein
MVDPARAVETAWSRPGSGERGPRRRPGPRLALTSARLSRAWCRGCLCPDSGRIERRPEHLNRGSFRDRAAARWAKGPPRMIKISSSRLAPAPPGRIGSGGRIQPAVCSCSWSPAPAVGLGRPALPHPWALNRLRPNRPPAPGIETPQETRSRRALARSDGPPTSRSRYGRAGSLTFLLSAQARCVGAEGTVRASARRGVSPSRLRVAVAVGATRRARATGRAARARVCGGLIPPWVVLSGPWRAGGGGWGPRPGCRGRLPGRR